MCYYNSVHIPKKQTIVIDNNTIPKPDDDIIIPVRNGFEYKPWPIVIHEHTGYKLVHAHWEYIPSWCTTWSTVEASRTKYTTLNAVGHTLLESNMYAESAMQRRCLILSSGFYEWHQRTIAGNKKPTKFPYYITTSDIDDTHYYYIAGIYNVYTNPVDNTVLLNFAMVTTQANELMLTIHNTKQRMPVLLTPTLAAQWLVPSLTSAQVQELANYQYSSSAMQAHTVAKDFVTSHTPNKLHTYNELLSLF